MPYELEPRYPIVGRTPTSGKIVLYEPLRTAFVVVAQYAALAGAGGFLVTLGGGVAVLGWALAVFFGACVLLGLVGFVMRDSLVLTERGFAITGAGPRIEYRWGQVRAFYTVEKSFLGIHGIHRTVVGIDFAPGQGGLFANPGVRWADRVSTITGTSTRVVTGDTGSLRWAYGLEPYDLVNLLERWRRVNTDKAADR